jgi:hypothetical protein
MSDRRRPNRGTLRASVNLCQCLPKNKKAIAEDSIGARTDETQG